MSNFFSQLKIEAQKIRLTESERRDMRRVLEHAFAPHDDVKSPVQVTPSPLLFISGRFMMPYAFVLMLAVVGGSTAYAAEAAIPGDILYPIKLNVNEKIAIALSASYKAKAEIHSKFAERRMREAETLVERSALTKEAKAELERRLETHAAEVDAAVELVELEDPIAAAEISARLESTFSAHGALIARLGEETDEVSKEESEHLARALKEIGRRSARAPREIALAAERGDKGIELQKFAVDPGIPIIAPVVIDTGDTLAARIQSNASSTLIEAERWLEKFKKNLNATTAEQVKRQIKKARDRIEQLHKEDTEGFEKALKEAKTLEVFIEAQEKFQERALLPAPFENGSEAEEEDELENEYDADILPSAMQ